MESIDDRHHESVSNGWVGDLSRRSFLRRSGVAAAAAAALGSVPGLSTFLVGGASEAPAVEGDAAQVVAAETEEGVGSLTQPLVAHVKDLNSGEISLFQGENETVIRDPGLARRLFSAGRP